MIKTPKAIVAVLRDAGMTCLSSARMVDNEPNDFLNISISNNSDFIQRFAKYTVPNNCTMTVARATPTVPKAGNPNHPKINSGSRIRFMKKPIIR
jgi:hypothetical protein